MNSINLILKNIKLYQDIFSQLNDVIALIEKDDEFGFSNILLINM